MSNTSINMSPSQSREDVFREKAKKYVVCFSEHCPLRTNCLRSLLSTYTSQDNLIVTSINLSNSATQNEQCPMFKSDKPLHMPVGLASIYHDMPGWMEKAIKHSLIETYSRKRYYEYHNGTRPITPDVENNVRELALSHGWQHELQFGGYVDSYIW